MLQNKDIALDDNNPSITKVQTYRRNNSHKERFEKSPRYLYKLS